MYVSLHIFFVGHFGLLGPSKPGSFLPLSLSLVCKLLKGLGSTSYTPKGVPPPSQRAHIFLSLVLHILQAVATDVPGRHPPKDPQL